MNKPGFKHHYWLTEKIENNKLSEIQIFTGLADYINFR